MRKISAVCILFLLSGLVSGGFLQAQEAGNQIKALTLSSRIVDQDGNPVTDARIYRGEGSVVVRAGADGSFSIEAEPESTLLIEAEGYASLEVEVLRDAIPAEITLTKQEYQLSDADVVNVPFGTLRKRHLTGSVTVLNPDEILKYDANQDIYSAMNGRVPGLFGNQDVYGMGNALLVVDGIPRPVSYLNLQEIGQITVLKDPVSRLLYGTKADLPVILLTTKRGEAYKRKMNVRLESGIMNPVSYPEYLGAADYMSLYNEALANDGKQPKYDSAEIAFTRNGDNFVLYPDEDYFNSNYLRKVQSYYSLITEASGGNDIARYYAYMGWDTRNSLLALGDNERYNRVNLRGNADYTINKYLRMRADGVAVFEFSRNLKNGDFWQNASTFLPNQSPVLIPVTNEDLLSAATLINDRYVLGGTSIYQDNIYGDMTLAGYTNTMNRIIQINTGLDADLSFITEGLSGKAYLTFDLKNYYETRQLNSYAVYEPVIVSAADGTDSIGLNKVGLDVRQGTESLINPDMYRRVGLFGTLNYHRVFNANHEISAIAVAYRQQLRLNSTLHETKDLHFGLQANYSYRKKYIAQGGLVLAGSQKLPAATRYGLSPAAGLAWVVSEEDFMPGNFFDFLKLRADWGLIHTDVGIDQYSLFQTSYSQGVNFNYYNGVVQNRVRNFLTIANPDLDWVKRRETSAGFEALVLDRSLQVEGTYFRGLAYDEIIARTNYYPSLLGDILPLENYESHLVQGMELGLDYHTGWDNLKLEVGANMVYSVPKVVQTDELNYAYDYLKRTGKPTDAMFGWVAEGLFMDQADIDNHAVQTFGDVQPGDIKYQDLNSDGIIDTNDVKVIGYSHPRIQYSVHLNLRYKIFELFVIGTGQAGQSSYFNNPYYWVYGERKYSTQVLGRWTPETAASATYPRLSSTNNSNNFRNSTYWLENVNWFNLQRVQLTINLPQRLADRSFVSGLQFYLRGSNLLTISSIREKLELNIGTAPQFRSFAAGINASF